MAKESNGDRVARFLDNLRHNVAGDMLKFETAGKIVISSNDHSETLDVTPENVIDICAALVSNTNIRTLTLPRDAYGSNWSSLKSLLESSNTTITTVNICSERGAQLVGDALPKNSGIRDIIYRHASGGGDEGMAYHYIAKGLEHNTHLRSFDTGRNFSVYEEYSGSMSEAYVDRTPDAIIQINAKCAANAARAEREATTASIGASGGSGGGFASREKTRRAEAREVSDQAPSK